MSEEKIKEETEAGANKQNLMRILGDAFDRLDFLSHAINAIGETREHIDEPGCNVLKGYLIDIAMDIRGGLDILDAFNLVPLEKPAWYKQQKAKE